MEPRQQRARPRGTSPRVIAGLKSGQLSGGPEKSRNPIHILPIHTASAFRRPSPPSPLWSSRGLSATEITCESPRAASPYLRIRRRSLRSCPAPRALHRSCPPRAPDGCTIPPNHIRPSPVSPQALCAHTRAPPSFAPPIPLTHIPATPLLPPCPPRVLHGRSS